MASPHLHSRFTRHHRCPADHADRSYQYQLCSSLRRLEPSLFDQPVAVCLSASGKPTLPLALGLPGSRDSAYSSPSPGCYCLSGRPNSVASQNLEDRFAFAATVRPSAEVKSTLFSSPQEFACFIAQGVGGWGVRGIVATFDKGRFAEGRRGLCTLGGVKLWRRICG